MKRFIALFLILILLLPLLACSRSPSGSNTLEPETQVTAEPENEARLRIADLPADDWEGRGFRIATDDASLILPQNGTNYVGKKIYERNQAVEEKYNISIILTEDSGLPTVTERIRTEALAGTDFCDLAVLSVSACQQLVMADVLQNVASIPYVSTGGSGIFQSASDSMTLGNTIYGISGDFCYRSDPVFTVYFNKVLATATGLPDLYQLVRDNQWDLENFQLYVEEAYSLGRIDGNKIYGFTSSERAETLLQAVLASSDFEYVVNSYGEKPALAYDGSAIRDALLNRAKKLLTKNVAYLDHTNASLDAFRDGQVLFFIAPLELIDELSGCRADWGILPMPKFDINQASRESYQNSGYQVACFPRGISNIDFSGEITQALFAASEGMSRDLTLTKYLNLYLRSAEDGEMLKQITSEPYFDPTEFFGLIYPEYLSATQTVIQRVVFSDGDYQKLYKQYSALFESFIEQKVS